MDGRRILVVEDDRQVRELVRERLERSGFHVRTVSDGRAAIDAVLASSPDLVVLDLVLPSVDGLDVLSVVRRRTDVPVIVLSGRGGEADRIVGLELGADDYLAKPFSARELVARVRSVLRRSHLAPRPARLVFDGLVIDPSTREVFVDGAPVVTTSREFELIHFLASSPRQVFSREQLLNQIWRSEPSWQDGATVTEHVYRVRHKIEIEPSHPRWIMTVWNVGYRFEPDGAPARTAAFRRPTQERNA